MNKARPYIWIAAAILLLYAKSLSFGYTFLDDNILILKNYAFLKDMANVVPAFFQKVFAGSHLPYYRPILTVSFILDAQAGGASPFFYHLTNIILHIVAASLVFLFLARLGYERLRALLFSMIFAVHPALSQGVAWIPGRNDTLMAVFVLASSVSFIGLMRTGKTLHYACHIIFFLLAIFTKETALVLMPVLFIYFYLVEKERLLSRDGIVLLAGWAACVSVWYVLRQAAVRGSMEFTAFDAGVLAMAYLPAAIQFTGKVFFPFNLSVFPIIQDTTFLYGMAAIAVLAAALALTKQKRYAYMLFGLAWAVLFLLPSLMRANYRISADFLEHRLYVPMVGFFIMLLETDLVKKAKRPAMIAVSSLIIAVFAVISFIHMDNFRDRGAFWSNAVRTSPHSTFAHMAMGQACYEEDRLDDAEAEFKKSLALDPIEDASLFGLGEVYLKKGMFADAQIFFRKSIAVYPFYDDAYLELGVACYKQGKFDEAEQAWSKAIAINPRNAGANKFLAIFYQERNDIEKARYFTRRLQEMGVAPPPEFMKTLGME